eukprot:jgi/Mesvir1/19134/Mv12871-RA.1
MASRAYARPQSASRMPRGVGQTPPSNRPQSAFPLTPEQRRSSTATPDKFRSPSVTRKSTGGVKQGPQKKEEEVRLCLDNLQLNTLENYGLPSRLEYLYVRYNNLTSLAGIEELTSLKILDASFNCLEDASLKSLSSCESLQQLYIDGNNFTTLEMLPELPYLEVLCASQNRITSFKMELQKNLKVLSFADNELESFSSFPDFPALEFLRVGGNQLEDNELWRTAAIILAGPTVKKINGDDVTPEEHADAAQYPPQSGLCIRSGWELCNKEEAAVLSCDYLAEMQKGRVPDGCSLRSCEVDEPVEGEPCRCYFDLEAPAEWIDAPPEEGLVLQYQWYRARDRRPFEKIENSTTETYVPTHDDIGAFLKAEVTPIVRGTECPAIFTMSMPVRKGSGIPKLLDLKISGLLEEGSTLKASATVAWSGGAPGISIPQWFRVVPGQEPEPVEEATTMDYSLTLQDVGCMVKLKFTPISEAGEKGDAGECQTQLVMPGRPKVENIHIEGYPVVGEVIVGLGDYFGGVEGASRFGWLREDKESPSGFTPVELSGNNQYRITEEDVGCRIKFTYTPISNEGIIGTAVSALTEPVEWPEPKVNDLMIVGDVEERATVSVKGRYSGGREGQSIIEWFVGDDEDSLEPLDTPANATNCTIPTSALGKFLAVRFTPVRYDGLVGKPVLVLSDEPIAEIAPRLDAISVTGNCEQGETLTASYTYVGGVEGSSSFGWYRRKETSAQSVLINGTRGKLEYALKEADIGYILSFKCTPKRSDGAEGEVYEANAPSRIRPAMPQVLGVKILGTPLEGSELRLEKTYFGGTEGKSQFQWLQISEDGSFVEIEGATGELYMVTPEDVGHELAVSVTPVRKDNVAGATVISDPTDPVEPAIPTVHSLSIVTLNADGSAAPQDSAPVEGGSLQLHVSVSAGKLGAPTLAWYRVTGDREMVVAQSVDKYAIKLEDCGSRIRVKYTPVLVSGVTGIEAEATTSTVHEGEPTASEVTIKGTPMEDVPVSVSWKYWGGREGDTKVRWIAAASALQGDALQQAAQEGFLGAGYAVLTDKKSYTPTAADVGKHLIVEVTPVRKDGTRGVPVAAASAGAIKAEAPASNGVTIKELQDGTFEATASYYGGIQGKSKYEWFRLKGGLPSSKTAIPGATERTFKPTPAENGHELMAAFTPVRADGVKGDTVYSTASRTLMPDFPILDKLRIVGEPMENESIFVEYTEDPKDKPYIKEIKLQWSRKQDKVGALFAPLPGEKKATYTVTLGDVGCCLQCQITVTDIFGRTGEPQSVSTAKVAAGHPKITNVLVEGSGFHAGKYTVKGTYFGGHEGSSRFKWFRSMLGGNLILIPEATSRSYEATADDVGYNLVAEYMPVRNDGKTGEAVSARTNTILIDKEMEKDVKAMISTGEGKFEVWRSSNTSNPEGRRLLDINVKRAKLLKAGWQGGLTKEEIRTTYLPPYKAKLPTDGSQTKCTILFSDTSSVDIYVHSRHTRDVILFVLRGMGKKF